ncbi:MAG TPA: HD domain-containing phosphohydrolase [Clostridia bacterium]|nr:HD domain-containing phosphohydrolase [Clostridia bacterium]
MKKSIYILIIFIVFFLNMNQSYGDEVVERNVLILHSYAQDFKWTNDFHEGIIEEILTSDLNINYQIEYLDTKKNYSEEYYRYLYGLYKLKFKNTDFDLIVTVDNNALDFVINNKKSLFDGLPVIAGGINNVSEYELSDDYYIIEETIDYEKTLEYMISLNNRLEKIYVINDDTRTGRTINEEIQSMINAEKDFPVTLEFINDLPISDLIEFSRTLDDTEGILFLLYFVDGNDLRLNYKEAISLMSEASKVPIFTVWDFYLNQGAIGGYLTSPKVHGNAVGASVKDFFAGKSILNYRNDLDYKDQQILDYELYQSYESYFTSEPKNVLWINKPASYFEKNRSMIVSFLFIIVVLLIIIFLSIEHIRNQKKVNKKDKAMMEIQTELIYTLGDVIETRSGETANHVKRVSKVAEYLAVKLGHKDISKIVLITSPLHDLGKIGIPDSILQKPNGLTDKEFEIMKQHTNIGYELLKNKNSKILNIAAKIAYEHQELWNGEGYPKGLKGREISLYARIVTVADVYDALRSERVYKESWSIQRTLNFFTEQKGKMFQPELVEIIMNNYLDIEKIRQKCNLNLDENYEVKDNEDLSVNI